MKKHLTFLAIAMALASNQQNTIAQPTLQTSGGTFTVAVPPVEPLPPAPAVRGFSRDIVQLAQADIQDAMRGTTDTIRNLQNSLTFMSGDGQSSGPGNTLIIPKENTDPKSLGELEEDLSVMSRVLEKAAGPNEKARNAMGISVHRRIFSGGGPRNLYIEGYGALFFLNVNFPLLPPPTEKAEAPAKPETSSEWEEARREVSGPNTFPFNGSPPGFGTWSGGGETAEEYDASVVDGLKQDLVSALKNGAYIRKLKPDEFVTVIVSGRANLVPAPAGARMGRRPDARSASGSPTPAHDTKLIVRARRSDIEAFQKDKITADEFKKKASVIVY
jgi:hypothetical protein